MRSVNDIRTTFLKFFEKEGHAVVPSSPLIPRNDPTLMFTNAGMVQFKNVFTGDEKRPYSTAVSSQKCLRAGGKHNDLENVGYTTRHHTFFEMLGNFSFGDYFKDRAIELAWSLITKEYGLSKDRLLATVYAEDDEAFNLWKKIAGLPESKIIRIPTNDNFWRMGDTGPCGPCSEIFYDHGDKIAGGPPGSADQDGDRFVEIWNLVFMQYEEKAGGERINLPRPSIDTGMGLERLSTVLQGKHDNYDTDLMRSLVEDVAHKTHSDPNGPDKASHRVIADHLRACSFLIAEGVLPSNEGRGYVLRRIMRRAMRHGLILGVPNCQQLMWQLVAELVHQMGSAYSELIQNKPLIEETLKLEEIRFDKTLTRGLALLDDATKNLQQGGQLSGDTAFALYDTYGFPLDLTQDALKKRSITVDAAGFENAMAAQKTKARAAWAGSGETATETVWFGVREKLGATEFLGYTRTQSEGEILALIREGKEVPEIKQGEEGFVVTNQTPFYGESGGQVGDAGKMLAKNTEADVVDTQKKLGDLFTHKVKVTKGVLKIGQAVDLIVDEERRSAIRANHSATHLLHEALRQTLGDHVAQKGSLVAPDRLRFDFSHPKAVEHEQLAHIEAQANRMIRNNSAVVTRVMPVDEAKASGARALFGEKYGDEVRVVSMGPENEGKAWSIELCGGTHVARTGDIGLTIIVSENGVSSGVRRIEALSGEAAQGWLQAKALSLATIADKLKTNISDVETRVESLINERRQLERELAELRKKNALGQDNEKPQTISGINYLARIVMGVAPNDLKSLVDEGKKKVGSGVVAFVGVNDDKAAIVVGVTNDLTSRFSAVDLVRSGAEKLGGKGGGGRPDMAQAGGPDAGQAQLALDTIAEVLAGAA
ncbi:MAG: alanine--tRNA ligase [Pseudomonadota bacterium]